MVLPKVDKRRSGEEDVGEIASTRRARRDSHGKICDAIQWEDYLSSGAEGSDSSKLGSPFSRSRRPWRRRRLNGVVSTAAGWHEIIGTVVTFWKIGSKIFATRNFSQLVSGSNQVPYSFSLPWETGIAAGMWYCAIGFLDRFVSNYLGFVRPVRPDRTDGSDTGHSNRKIFRLERRFQSLQPKQTNKTKTKTNPKPQLFGGWGCVCMGLA